jgi:hypothetical protein
MHADIETVIGEILRLDGFRKRNLIAFIYVHVPSGIYISPTQVNGISLSGRLRTTQDLLFIV